MVECYRVRSSPMRRHPGSRRSGRVSSAASPFEGLRLSGSSEHVRVPVEIALPTGHRLKDTFRVSAADREIDGRDA